MISKAPDSKAQQSWFRPLEVNVREKFSRMRVSPSVSTERFSHTGARRTGRTVIVTWAWTGVRSQCRLHMTVTKWPEEGEL